MIKFALVASGSKGNCCVVKNSATSIIIDCGCTQKYLKNSFEKLKFDWNKSDALFITHTHTDHVGALKMFSHIETYATADLNLDTYHRINPFEVVELPSLSVQSIPTSHDAPMSCGYVIKSHEQKLVYITDTGYINQNIIEYILDADYYIFESNHDIGMLMQTSRPPFVKQRIAGDSGHLCNEDSAQILSEVIGKHTKEIVLAHISEEGNSRALAKQVLIDRLKEKQIDYSNIKITSAPQFEIVVGGEND